MASKPTEKVEPAAVVNEELLQSLLLFADELYRAGRDDKEHPDHGLGGVLMALWAVMAWLRCRDSRLAVVRPLLVLETALDDLRRGVTVPLLKAKPLHHRPPLSSARHVLAVCTSVSMTLLMNAGRSKQEAAEWVAEKLPKTKDKATNATTIARWRDDLTGASAAGDDDADIVSVKRYRDILALCGKQFEPPERIAERLLSIAPDFSE